MTNSNKMTLEEKIVQTIKNETLFQLIGSGVALPRLMLAWKKKYANI